MKIAVIATVIVITVGVVAMFLLKTDSDTPIVTQAVLQTEMQKENKPLLLDVRSADEFKEGHIPGAYNIAHSLLANRLQEVGNDKSQNIVVYCRSGRRAAVAEGILKGAGYTNIRHLQGDMLGWQAAGLEQEKST